MRGENGLKAASARKASAPADNSRLSVSNRKGAEELEQPRSQPRFRNSTQDDSSHRSKKPPRTRKQTRHPHVRSDDRDQAAPREWPVRASADGAIVRGAEGSRNPNRRERPQTQRAAACSKAGAWLASTGCVLRQSSEKNSPPAFTVAQASKKAAPLFEDPEVPPSLPPK
jgi:hypothetical protein